MLASCEVTQGVGDTYRDLFKVAPRYLGSEQNGRFSLIEVDFQLTLGFLVVEMEDCRHRFCGAEL